MAKKSNKANFSIEEMLEQAKVAPKNEPYKIPENWCWIKLGVVCALDKGESNSNENLTYFDAKILRTEKKIDLRNSGVIVKKGQKVILVDGENSGEVFVIPYRGYMGSTFRILNISNNIDDTFIQYFIDHKADTLKNNKVGSAIPHLNKDLFYGLELPLSPLLEQHRIVEHIDTLFSKLDEAKEKAQEILNSFEMRKTSILNNAFSGKLTEKWRKEHKIGLNSWKKKKLGDVCKSIYDGDHMPPPKSEAGIPFLVISNVNTGYLSFEDTRFVPQDYYDSLTDTRKPEKGDVLYTLVGSYGIPVVVDVDAPFCFQRHMALLKPKSINTFFLWYLLQTQEMYQKASLLAKGVAQLTVPIKGLRLMEFDCPTEKEQVEIVNVLKELFDKENRAKHNAEHIIEQIDLMKKSILSKAFRGELGTNNSKDESAEMLLKRILIGEKYEN